MSLYSVKGKGWRYDFTLKGERHTEAWFKTRKEAAQAEAKRKEELNTPRPMESEIPTDMAFLDLLNTRLDFIEAYKTRSYYEDNRYLFQRLAQRWGKLDIRGISSSMIQQYILDRAKHSHYAANYDLRLLKALFNHAIRIKIIKENPVAGVPFLPVEKKTKYVPPIEDIDKVIKIADPDTQDYLWVIRESMGRMGEINRLTWNDVDLLNRFVTLFTRKKKGGHLTPRKVPMTGKLHEILSRRYQTRDKEKPWVFWVRYWCRKTNQWKEGPYQDRKKIMATLCRKAGVKYFRFHALRHAGASIMDNSNVPIVAIQEILGHENRTTTEIYLHSVSGAARQAMAVYEAARRNSHTESHTNENGSQVKTRNPLIFLVGR
jgi:integrase